MTERINSAALAAMLCCASAALNENREDINRLNVFPVPDGDTGTNMSLTMSAAASALEKNVPGSVSDTMDSAAGALLRGARGNSGVILSLLFRGMAKSLRGVGECDAAQWARAMSDGVEAAYKAVMKPAEGTILTVSRLAAEAAEKSALFSNDVEELFASSLDAAREALAATREQNPVLKKAGVIDSGGKGYVVILEAMLASLRGEMVATGTAARAPEETVFETSGDVLMEAITFAFDTVYIVRKDTPDVDLTPLRQYLDSIGDSLVISEDDEIFKVHVHTDTPGVALTESQKYGTLELAKIENMVIQAEQLKAGKKAQSTDDLEQVDAELSAMGTATAITGEPVVAEAEKDVGVVAVCAGDGLSELFHSVGADRVVTGGQTMNPSTDDILREVNQTPADTVFVFPNNKNIIMAAEQCIPLTEKKVIVVPTRTVPQGLNALIYHDPSLPVEAMKDEFMESANRVHTILVTSAARDSAFDGKNIRAGEYLALMDGKLLGSYRKFRPLLRELNRTVEELNPELITIYYGADVTEKDANTVADSLRSAFDETDITIFNGGQPVYYYMISGE